MEEQGANQECSKRVRDRYLVGPCLRLAPQGQTKQISSRGKTSAEALREYGIDLSEPALLKALKNPNGRIRILAAHQLANDNDADAVPAVEQAFVDERESMARVGIATALVSLHDPNGAKDLEAMCIDGKLPIQSVVAATQMLQMLFISSGVCLPRVLQSLANPAEIDYRDVTISLLPSTSRGLSSEQTVNIVATIEHFLLDQRQQPAVRLQAGNALAEMGSSSSTGVLQTALTNEKDATMRSSFQADLDRLKPTPPN